MGRKMSSAENASSGNTAIRGVEIGLVLTGVLLVSFLFVLDGGLSSFTFLDGGTVPSDTVAHNLKLRRRSLLAASTTEILSSDSYVATNISTGMISLQAGAASNPLYHNSALFEKDYDQMEKNFKIFVYPEAFEGSGNYSHVFLPHTHPENKNIGNYFSEHKFKIILLKSKFVTNNPDEAHLFYLPFSVNVLRNDESVRTEPSIIRFVKDYIANVSREYEYWNRSRGADHFFACCHSVGRDVPEALPTLKSNAIQLVCSSNYYYKNYVPHKDVALPQIWPRKSADILNPPEKRSRLAFYAGRIQNSNIRTRLIETWGADPDFDFFGGGTNGSYENHFKISKFCVHVRGYEVNTARISDAIHFGCVPVIISEYYDLPLGDILDWSQFSVIISHTRVPDLKKILGGVTEEQYAVLYDNVLKVRKHFQWHDIPQKYDAFSLSLYQLWLKRKAKTPGQRGRIDLTLSPASLTCKEEDEDVFADKVIGLTYCECIFLNSKDEFLLATTRNEDINQKDPHSGDTPIIAATKQGRKELIPMILDLHPDPNLRNNSGDTALHWACLKGYESVITQLLKMGADKDARGEYGNTPMHLACSGSHVECVNILLLEGASARLRNEFGNNALQMASNVDIKKRIKGFMDNADIARKLLVAEELAKKKKQEQDEEAALAIQEEIARKKMEEEAIIKAKRDAVAAEELRIEQEEAAAEAARLAEEQRLEQERLEAERLIAEEKKASKKGSKKKKTSKKKKKKAKKEETMESTVEEKTEVKKEETEATKPEEISEVKTEEKTEVKTEEKTEINTQENTEAKPSDNSEVKIEEKTQ